MADPKPPAPEPPGAPAMPVSGQATKPAPRNPALRMLGLPALPKKLPSRNWMIFWTLSTSLAAAIIYDKREKKRATARWAQAVAPLAQEPLKNPRDMVRKITVFLECPPGDHLIISQKHFIEYVKPVLAASGLDWEFVQGREEGDVRAAVAERIRRQRRAVERPGETELETNDAIVAELRQKSGIEEYEGIKGDMIIGRHTWKEYMRGLHEGWLGPLDPPAKPETLETSNAPEKPNAPEQPKAQESPIQDLADAVKPEDDNKPAEEKKPDGEKPEENKKPKRPPQPPPYNAPEDYSAAAIPPYIPTELAPTVLIQEPHILGFSNTPRRFNWFLNRRKLADDIGRQTAAICFAAAHNWSDGVSSSDEVPQDKALAHEEGFWPKFVWKDEQVDEDGNKKPVREKIWTAPMVTDSRIVSRMQKFEIQPEHEDRAKNMVVPEEQVEGWIKGSLRSLGRWGINKWNGRNWSPNVGDISEAD